MSEMQEFRQAIAGNEYFNLFKFVTIPTSKRSSARRYIGLLVDPCDRTPLVDAIWRSKGMAELEPTRETAERFLAAMCGIHEQQPGQNAELMRLVLSGRQINIPGGWVGPGGLSVMYDYETTAESEYRFRTSVKTSSSSSGENEELESLESNLEAVVDGAIFESIDSCNVNEVTHHDESSDCVDSSQSIYISNVSIVDDDGYEVFSARTNLSFYDSDDVKEFERKLLYAYSEGGNA